MSEQPRGLWRLVPILGILFVGGATLVTFLTLSQGSLSDRDSTSPGLVCREDVYDFGSITLKEAAELGHTFALTNTSDRPIALLEHSSSCGCTLVEFAEDAVVMPGTTMNVPVKAHWPGRVGAQSAVIYVATDDARTPTITLAMKAFIKCPAILTPSVVNFGLLDPDQKATRVVKLHPGTDPRPFHLTDVNIPSANISVTRVPMQPGEEPEPLLKGSCGDFVLTITAPRIGGREQTRIVFGTDLPDRPEVWLDVQARFKGALVPSPRSVFFSATGAESGFLRSVTITGVGCGTDGGIKAAVTVDSNGGVSPFSIAKVVPIGEPPDFTGVVVTVHLDRSKARNALCRADLRVTSGMDSVDIPLVAMCPAGE